MKFIFGLGNPGKDYIRTRHNLGFEVVDRLAASLEADWKRDTAHHAMVAKGMIAGTPVFLIKPTTFMNESGQTIQSLLSYYKGSVEDVLIIHDEMDLDPGRRAFLGEGGAAGHNGVGDIQERLGTKKITRLRLGIGRPIGAHGMNPQPKEDWVLGKPDKEDKEKIERAVEQAVEATKDWMKDGLEKAMNKWNTGKT